MSMVPPPPAAPTWPSYPQPEPRQNQRRWPAITASLGASAAVAGIITTAVTLAVTPEPAVTVAASAAPQIVTVTAAPSTPPAPLSTAEADKQTCHAWGTTDTLYNAAVVAQSVIPKGMTVLDPACTRQPGMEGRRDAGQPVVRPGRRQLRSANCTWHQPDAGSGR